MLEIQPYHNLWRAVIAAAIEDVKIAIRGETFCDYYQQRVNYRFDTSVAWFLGKGRDFNMVCHLAGLEPSEVRDVVVKMVNRGGELKI